MDKTVLLVGGDGFIGSNLQKELISRGIKVHSIDKNEEDFTKSIDLLVEKMSESTHVMFLASEVGAKLFNETPIEPFIVNSYMTEAFYCAIVRNYKTFNNKLNVSWFSSSEIFNSTSENDVIKDEKYAKIDLTNTRSLYSTVKVTGELLFRDLYDKNIINSLNIFRLFNVSGKNQKRGVLFDMVQSALINNIIEYSENTTRTITSVKYAVNQIINGMFSNENSIKTYNIAENRNSMCMKDLALIVKDTLECCDLCKNVKLVKKSVDKFIQYRHTEIPNPNRVDDCGIRKCITDILEDL